MRKKLNGKKVVCGCGHHKYDDDGGGGGLIQNQIFFCSFLKNKNIHQHKHVE